MNESPRVQRLVLFKHGVAFVERGGPADGPFTLSFKRDEMNDVLKSLALWVADGDGRVGSVGFEAPKDPERELEEHGLLLESGAGLHQLMHAFRGRRVELDDGNGRRAGEIVALQASQRRGEGAVPDRLLLRVGAGELDLVGLDTIRSLKLIDEPARADLALMVAKSREATARERRTIRVDLDGSASDLRVAYIVPAPVWRVSYRLIVDEAKCTIMAWAIVHNPVDEDLEGVALTLTTGQPMSFVIDLYQPKHVQRARLEEQERGAVAPRPVGRARAKRAVAGAALPAPAMAPAFAMAAVAGEMAEEMAEASSTGERSEYFEYRVNTPLDVARGGSAMVPLTAGEVECRRERLWRAGQGPHPDVVLRFDNDTEVVLEEGAAVVYDDGGYAGEAMMPYSARGAEVRLPFAKDLAVRCSHETDYERRTYHVRFGGEASIESWEHFLTHEMVAESDHAEPVDVTFEISKQLGREIAPDGPQPTEETATRWRFSASVPPGERGELRVVERWRTAQQIQMASVSVDRLRQWIGSEFLSDGTAKALQEVLEAWVLRDRKLGQRAKAEAELQEVYRAQEAINHQLAVLKEGGEEGRLRARYAEELSQYQDRARLLGDRMKDLGGEAEEILRDARAKLDALGEQDPGPG
jgi:hypothetical protein